MVIHQAPEWSFAEAVTPSDAADNVVNARFLHNNGTAGSVSILFTNGVQATLYFAQGATIPGGLWRRVRSTGLTAGLSLVALY